MSTASSLQVSGPLNRGLEPVGPGTPALPRLLGSHGGQHRGLDVTEALGCVQG